MQAKDIVAKYNNKYKKLTECSISLSSDDVKAKNIVESLIDNDFSIDTPTIKDAALEICKLSDVSSIISKKMFDIFNDITSNCSIDDLGNITLNLENIKRNY